MKKNLFVLICLFFINSNSAEKKLSSEQRSQLEREICYNLKDIEDQKKQDICVLITSKLIAKAQQKTFLCYKQLIERNIQLKQVNNTLSKLSNYVSQSEDNEFFDVKKEIVADLEKLKLKLKNYIPEDESVDSLEKFIINNLKVLADEEILNICRTPIKNVPNMYCCNNKNNKKIDIKDIEKAENTIKEKLRKEKASWEAWRSDNSPQGDLPLEEYERKFASYLSMKQKLEKELEEITR